VAMVEDDEYQDLMKKKAAAKTITKFGDYYNPEHTDNIKKNTAANMAGL
jgi:hypothetical protein